MLQNGEYQGMYADIESHVIRNPFCPLNGFSPKFFFKFQ